MYENCMTAEAILRKINPRGKPVAADKAISRRAETLGRTARLKDGTFVIRT